MRSPKTTGRLLLLSASLLLLITGCRAIIRACLPKRPLPPHHWTTLELPVADGGEKMDWADKTDAEWVEHYTEKMREAQDYSNRLQTYIRHWLAGKAPAKIPAELLPPTIENEKTKGWTLCRPEKVKAEEQWMIRPANEIPEDYSRLFFLSPDNHCTYGKLLFLAPFGAKLVVEGDFPHARFFDYPITPPFDPRSPCAVMMGAPEVPIVDVDIEPDKGHVNPFREGANRKAEKRRYHVTFELQAGNPVTLNPKAFVPPAYRAPGNTRVGGPFAYTGAWGLGTIVPGLLWLRYYAPDRGTGPLAGVPLPKAHLELSSGERFWIRCDFSGAEKRQNHTVSGFSTEPEDPPSFMGPGKGWWKMFGIWLIIGEANGYVFSRSWLISTSLAKRTVRRADRKLFCRGPEMAPPGNYECSATCCNYINYLVRPISLGKGKVIVLTGKLPETPKTREGEPKAVRAECRYWSIARTADSPDKRYPCILYGCLMDDEIVLDEKRRYVIVYSRKEDRPANATPAAGVTWQDWGPPAMQVMNIRWLSVMPEEHLARYAPDEKNIPWEAGAWSQEKYDESLVGRNPGPGLLGPYHPEIHYLTREAFEALGASVDPEAVPEWK
ncbi:MAG: hypothetical protein ACYTHN_09870 [Planctomycetota bacterium]|jgi:hypothetical protein